MSDLIQIARDTAANWAAVVLELGTPALITDEGALVVGDGVTAVAGLTRFQTGGPAYEPIDENSAGTTTIVMAIGKTSYASRLVLDVGSGVYTRKVALPVANRVAGQSAEFSVRLPASANPTIEIRNASGSGTILFTMTGDATTARFFYVRCIFTELGAWEVFETREIL